MSANRNRRTLLKFTGLALAAVMGRAEATTNAALRAKLKYRDSPNGNMSCTNCLEFIPGKTGQGPGRCNKIPGDDEISPNGYCMAWNSM